MKDLAKAMEACEKFDELKEEFISTLCAEMKSRGLSELDTKELGEAVDIIKDFAEAKKDCMEALYYQKVTEAMLSSEEPRYGYNTNRWSNGRYAPKGMGSRGYMSKMDYVEDPIYYDEDWNVMGYGGQSGRISSGGNNSGRSNSSNNSSSNSSYGYSDWHMHRDPEYDERYGRSYNDFRKNRRFYTATKSEEEKKEMERHAEEHIQDFIVSIKDIWKDADPNLKKRMKDHLNRLVSELSI